MILQHTSLGFLAIYEFAHLADAGNLSMFVRWLSEQSTKWCLLVLLRVNQVNNINWLNLLDLMR